MGTFIQFLREKFGITVLEDHCAYELGKKIRGLLLPYVNERPLQSVTTNDLRKSPETVGLRLCLDVGIC